jgi:hypothetical protein
MRSGLIQPLKLRARWKNFILSFNGITIIIIIIISLSIVSRLFSPVLLLNQQRSPPLRLQVSDCSTVRITCDVPSTAVVCSEYVECFTTVAYKYVFKPSVTIPVAPIMCDVTSTAVFCSEYVECFTAVAYKYVFKPSVTIPVAPIMCDVPSTAVL